MKFLLLIAICFIFGDADAESWSPEQRTLAGVYLAAHVIDWGQTRRIAREPHIWHEYNPLLPRHPSIAQVNRHFLLVPIVGYFIADALPSRHRTTALYWAATIQVSVVARNHYLGIRVSF